MSLNSKLRGHVFPVKPIEDKEKPKPYFIIWIRRLLRVFAIDPETCHKCGGSVEIIASIEEPGVIRKVLGHLGLDQPANPQSRSPPPDQVRQQPILL